MADRALIEQLDQAINEMIGEMPAGAKQAASEDPTLPGLMKIAESLRDLPDDGFKTRLRRTLMTTTAEFTAIRTITPFITVTEGAKLIELMKHTFDAEEMTRHPHGPDGLMPAVTIVDSDLLLMPG